VSKHWNPEEELALVREARVRREWPAGATVGLALVAAACAGVVVTLYYIAGPRNSIADDSTVNWDEVAGSPDANERG
jgi:hypothetical protein